MAAAQHVTGTCIHCSPHLSPTGEWQAGRGRRLVMVGGKGAEVGGRGTRKRGNFNATMMGRSRRAYLEMKEAGVVEAIQPAPVFVAQGSRGSTCGVARSREQSLSNEPFDPGCRQPQDDGTRSSQRRIARVSS